MQSLLVQVDQVGLCRSEPEAKVIEYIDQVQRAYCELNRSECDVESLVGLKFKMQHWRQRVFEQLCPRGDLWKFRALSKLQFRPGEQDLLVLKEQATRESDNRFRSEADGYFNVLGAHKFISEGQARVLAGPKRNPPIAANTPSRCTFEKWVKESEFSAYQFEGDGLRYRGLELLPGDVLIANVNRDGNGVYTAMVEPRSFGYHLGLFAIIDHEGRKVPVVLETYKLGVRAVPLSTFFDPAFNSYLEVCRLKDKPEDFSRKINEEAKKLPAAIKGYNFDTEDTDREYISCTAMGTHLLELAGGARIFAKSRYFQEPLVQRNLGQYDFVLPAFLSPTDFIVDPKMQVIGVIDNGHFRRNLTRELCEREFVRIFGSGKLDLSKLPLMFALNRFGVRQMRAGTVLGKLIGLSLGFNSTNFPKGPEKVLAVIEVYEHLIDAAVKEANDRIDALWRHSETVDLHTLDQNPEIRAVLKYAMRPIALAFVK